MALDKTSMASKILTNIQACNVNLTGADTAIIQSCLEAFCQGIIEEITQNGSIVMDAADFQVNPGTFKDSTNTLITGQGDNASFDLTGKIQ